MQITCEDFSFLSRLVLGFLVAELQLLLAMYWGHKKHGGLSRSKSAPLQLIASALGNVFPQRRCCTSYLSLDTVGRKAETAFSLHLYLPFGKKIFPIGTKERTAFYVKYSGKLLI